MYMAEIIKHASGIHPSVRPIFFLMLLESLRHMLRMLRGAAPGANAASVRIGHSLSESQYLFATVLSVQSIMYCCTEAYTVSVCPSAHCCYAALQKTAGVSQSCLWLLVCCHIRGRSTSTVLDYMNAFSSFSWLGSRKSIRPIENLSAGIVMCLEQGANDLHMVQLMPLPLPSSLLQKIQNVLTFWYQPTQVVLKKGR